MLNKILRIVAVCLAFACSPSSAADQVTIKIGYPAGGGFDNFGRLMSRHLGKHLEGNPSFIVQNVPGGGSLKLALSMQSSEPADGSVIAMVASTLATGPMLDPEMKDLDPTTFKWIGSLSNQSNICMTGKSSGISTLEEFRTKEFAMGASGKASSTYIFAALIKNVLNAKFKIITGFEGSTDIDAAVLRGEVAGRCGTSYDSMISLGLIDDYNIITRVGQGAGSAPESIPAIYDYASNDLDRLAIRFIAGPLEFHQAFLLPSSTPEDVVSKYRGAFVDTLKDPEFLADVANLKLVIAPKTGAEIDAIAVELQKVDPAVVKRARELIQ